MFQDTDCKYKISRPFMLILVPQKTEAFAQACSVKKVFLEISQNSQENTFVIVSFLIKLQACAPGTGVFL